MARFVAKTVSAVAVVFLVLTILKGEVDCRGGRGGGGSRGGSRYTGSRSPTSSRSYQTARYSRAYSGVGVSPYYTYYHGLYFTYIGSPAFYERSRPTGDVQVCINYEANDNGTFLGAFKCPLLDEEPSKFTECCGVQYAEYCCSQASRLSTGYADGIIGILMKLAMLLVSAWVVPKFTPG